MALAAGKSLGQAVWLVIVTLIFIPGLWAKLDDLNEGGYLLEDTVVSRSDSPVTLRNSLIVAEEVTLTIEPGVELKFAPGVMLAVNGTLTARVSMGVGDIVGYGGDAAGVSVYGYTADAWHSNNVIITPKRRCNVVLT